MNIGGTVSRERGLRRGTGKHRVQEKVSRKAERETEGCAQKRKETAGSMTPGKSKSYGILDQVTMWGSWEKKRTSQVTWGTKRPDLVIKVLGA